MTTPASKTRNTPKARPQMQGKAAEWVEARHLRHDDIIACPGKPVEMGVARRLELVVVDGDVVRAKTAKVEKWYTFRAGEMVLRRVDR